MAKKSTTTRVIDGNLCRVGAKITRIASQDDCSALWDNGDVFTLKTTPCPACKAAKNHSFDHHRQFVPAGDDALYTRPINTGSPWS